MDLNERFNVLVQGVEFAQKSGVLTLDDAVEAKNKIDKIQKGEDLKDSLNALVKMCETAQKAGIYTLHDAYLLFLASNEIEKEVDNFIEANTQKAENVEVPVAPEGNSDTENQKEVTEDKQGEPEKKSSRKK